MDRAELQALLKWQDEQPDGFHGILTDPLGNRGFTSVSGNGSSFSWFQIGEDQDEIEVMDVAKRLHDAMEAPNVSMDYLRFLGRRAVELSKPKVARQEILDP